MIDEQVQMYIELSQRHDDAFTEFSEAEPEIIKQVLPSLILLSRSFTYWLLDEKRLSMDEAQVLLDTLRSLEAEVAD